MGEHAHVAQPLGAHVTQLLAVEGLPHQAVVGVEQHAAGAGRGDQLDQQVGQALMIQAHRDLDRLHGQGLRHLGAGAGGTAAHIRDAPFTARHRDLLSRQLHQRRQRGVVGGGRQGLVHIDETKAIGGAVPEAGGVALPPFQAGDLAGLTVGGGIADLGRLLAGIDAGGVAGQQIAQIPHRQIRVGGHQQRHGARGVGGGRRGAVHHAVVVAGGIQLRVVVQPVGTGIVGAVVAHVAAGQIRGHHGRRIGTVLPAGGAQEDVAADAGVGGTHSIGVDGAHHQVPEVAVGGIYVAVLERQLGHVADAVEAVACRLDIGRALRLLGLLLEQAIELNLIQPAGALRIHQAHAVALVEDAVVGGGCAAAQRIDPVFLQLLAALIQQVEPLQLDAGGHPQSADAVVDRPDQAGDRGAVGTVRIGRGGVAAAGDHVLRARAHIVGQVRVGDGQAVIHHGHVDALTLHAGTVCPPEVEVVACHAATGAEGILAAVEQVPLLILQRVDAGQAARCAAATGIEAGFLAGQWGATLTRLN